MFRLENIGNETVTIGRTHPPGWPKEYMTTSYQNVSGNTYHLDKEFHFGFRVTYINETEIYSLMSGILPYDYEFHIDPDDWIEQAIILDYYSIEWAEIYNPYQLSPGAYLIRGAAHYDLDSSWHTLKTPSITFVIG